MARDAAPPADESEVGRPALDTVNAAAGSANEAVVRLLEDLQAGWDQHDADITDRHVADDVLWGSPFGATLQGYEPLHAVHIRLKFQAMGGSSSRFEIVQVLVPAPNIAIAHVRRVALDPEGRPLEPTSDMSGAFSETALYVLIRRNRTWWLAAGHNTPIRPQPARDNA